MLAMHYPGSPFVANPHMPQYTLKLVDSTFLLNIAYTWPKPHTGIWLYDGVGEVATPGITINAGAGDVVNLRGLTMKGGQPGAPVNGIAFNGGALNVQNCVIRGFSGNGINFFPDTSAKLNILDTILSGNAADGIWVQPSGGTTIASFVRVQATGNYNHGFFVDTSSGANFITASAADSVASGNGTGFQLGGGQFTIVNSQAIGGGTGLSTSGQGTFMYLAHSTVSGNSGFGYTGNIFTFGNNFITDLGSPSATLTPIAQQ